MKKTLLFSFVSAASAIAAVAADPDQAQLQGYPKNLARQHLGANLFQYSPTTQAYAPTQASAAWLDDDITTGWAMLSGKQHYVLAFPEAQQISTFSMSARPASGTISLYAGDEAAPPGAKSWTLLARDIPVEMVNEKRLGKSFARLAKYLLIETNLSDPGPVYSLYVYGDRPAVDYTIASREQPIDARAHFGPYVNETTTFSVSSLYARSRVHPQEGVGDFTELQKAIDDNPETFVTVGGTQPPVLEVRSPEPRSISRVAVEVNPGAKGRLELFVKDADAAAPAGAPAATIMLDGTSSRASVDFAAVQGSILQARWTPANGTDAVSIHELNAFAGNTLAMNTVLPEGDTVVTDVDGAERRVARARTGRDGKDGKDAKDAKIARDGKEGKEDLLPDAVAALDQGPYLPGALGFPPNLTVRRTPVLPPEEPQPVSPE
jgi:hypothetical protein